MNSPDKHSIIPFIKINRKSKDPIYLQICNHIIISIQQEKIKINDFLPSSRTLSKELNVHRNTVTAAYEELAMQNWIKIIPKKGSVVTHIKKYSSKAFSKNTDVKIGFNFQNTPQLKSPFDEFQNQLTLNDGLPDMRLIDYKNINKWHKNSIKNTHYNQEWNTPYRESSTFFKKQLINYLNITRDFLSKPKHLFSSKTKELCLYLLSNILLSKDDIILIPEINLFSSNMIFQKTGAKIIQIPVHKEGININFIRTHFTKGNIRLLYLSSRQLYPTHLVLSENNKKELLKLADEYNFAIIEDDSNFDFKFNEKKNTTLKHLDVSGRVIYLSSFGQFLPPTFQLGLILAPENLINELNNYAQMIDKYGDLTTEKTIAQMLNEGEVYKILEKTKSAYKLRKQKAIYLLKKEFKNKLIVHELQYGLAVWCTFKNKHSLNDWTNKANELKLTIPKYILYHTKNICGFRFGFGNLNEGELTIAIQKLYSSYKLSIKNKAKN